MKIRFASSLLLSALLICGCRTASYWAWEKLGVQKRDLLKKDVVAARDDQKAASQQFKDAMTRLKELTGFEGGNLEKTYTALNKDYERSVERANTVHKRVKEVETVAGDLFAEWENENKQISSADLRDKSSQQLRDTRQRYDELHTALKRAEQSMDPVLTRLHDQVLFLKHNLNAAAIASLKGESANIQTDIGKLLDDMNAAIAQADKFIKTMP